MQTKSMLGRLYEKNQFTFSDSSVVFWPSALAKSSTLMMPRSSSSETSNVNDRNETLTRITLRNGFQFSCTHFWLSECGVWLWHKSTEYLRKVLRGRPHRLALVLVGLQIFRRLKNMPLYHTSYSYSIINTRYLLTYEFYKVPTTVYAQFNFDLRRQMGPSG
jgi:hypothetical protein